MRTVQITLNVAMCEGTRFPGIPGGHEAARIARLCREAAQDALESHTFGDRPLVSAVIEQQPEAAL